MILDYLTWNQAKAIGRHALSYGAGAITVGAAWGLIDHVQANDLSTGIQLIGDGISQVAKGVALIAGVAMPIYNAWRSAHSASPAEQAKSVANAGNLVVSPTGGSDTTNIANKIAAMPDVGKVISTVAVAAATPSAKVTTG